MHATSTVPVLYHDDNPMVNESTVPVLRGCAVRTRCVVLGAMCLSGSVLSTPIRSTKVSAVPLCPPCTIAARNSGVNSGRTWCLLLTFTNERTNGTGIFVTDGELYFEKEWRRASDGEVRVCVVLTWWSCSGSEIQIFLHGTAHTVRDRKFCDGACKICHNGHPQKSDYRYFREKKYVLVSVVFNK